MVSFSYELTLNGDHNYFVESSAEKHRVSSCLEGYFLSIYSSLYLYVLYHAFSILEIYFLSILLFLATSFVY